MMMRKAGSEVGKISLRERSGSSVTLMPAAASSGSVSLKMRPLDKARVRVLLVSLVSFMNIRWASAPPQPATRRICAPRAESFSSICS